VEEIGTLPPSLTYLGVQGCSKEIRIGTLPNLKFLLCPISCVSGAVLPSTLEQLRLINDLYHLSFKIGGVDVAMVKEENVEYYLHYSK